PTVPSFRNDLAIAEECCGFCHSLLRERAEALGAYRRARDLWQQLAAENPRDGLYRVSLVITLGNLLNEQTLVGQWAEAAETERQGMAITDQLVAKFPDVASHLELLGWYGTAVTPCQEHTGRVREAEATHRRTLAAYERLATRFPTVPRFRSR